MPNNDDKCSNCGATEGLMKCSRCSSASYCSKECQVSHWPKHKVICNMVSKAKKSSNEFDAIGQILLESKRGGHNIIKLEMTHAGPVSSDDKVMPAGVPENFLFINEACDEYAMRREGKREYGEAFYKRLFDDLVGNEKEWMNFFQYPTNACHCGDAIMILGKLADIYRARKTFEELGNVLDMQSKLMFYFKRHCQAPDSCKDMKSFYARSEYMMNLNRLSVNGHLEKFDESISLFRWLCEEEVARSMARKEQICNNMWRECIEVNDAIFGTPMGVKSIHDLSDGRIVTCLKIHHHMKHTMDKIANENPGAEEFLDKLAAQAMGISVDEYVRKHKNKTKLLSCGNCHKTEAALGDFKKCQNCKQVVYCRKKCQRQHWKVHKKCCVKK